MKGALLIVLLGSFTETRGAWVNPTATKRSVQCVLQANGNDGNALTGQVLPQGILGVYREPTVNKIPWKGPGAVGFKEPEAIREMTVFDRSSPAPMVAEGKEQQGELKDKGVSKSEIVVADRNKRALSPQNDKPSDGRNAVIAQVPFVQRTDPGFMSPDVIATVRINEQQYQVSPSSDAVSIESSNRKARDAAILRFESSSWAAENLKSEKASADVLTRVNIGIGASAANLSPPTTTDSKNTARIGDTSKGAQDWTSGNVKASKESADVLTKVKIHDEIVNLPSSQTTQTSLPITPDQPDVLGTVKINEGSVAKNLGAVAKPAKESADVQTPVKIHEDIALTDVAKPSKASADVQTSVKIHENEKPSETAKPTKESADVLTSVKINANSKQDVTSASAKGTQSVSATQINGDKQDIVKPFDKSNSQPPIVEPILVDKLPKSNYKNDLDDIITVESEDDKPVVLSDRFDIAEGSGVEAADDETDGEATLAYDSAELNKPIDVQIEPTYSALPKTLEESNEVLASVQVTKDATPAQVAKPDKESADVLTSVKMHEDTKPAQVAKPTKESADVLTSVKIHADVKRAPLAKPSKDSADVQTPVKIHAEMKPVQSATPLKDSADVLTPVKIHAEAKPTLLPQPSKESIDLQTPAQIAADVLTPVKIHADSKPAARALTPLKASADVQTPVKIHADTKPPQTATPLKDSADVQTPVKIHADAKPIPLPKPAKDTTSVQTSAKVQADTMPAQIAADVLTPVKIHADTKPTPLPKPSKESADVQTPVKIHADTKPTPLPKPSKESADVQTPVKIHADTKPTPLPKPSKESADVQKPVKIYDGVNPTKRGSPMKDSADVQTPVKIHEEVKASTVTKESKEPTSITVNGAKAMKPLDSIKKDLSESASSKSVNRESGIRPSSDGLSNNNVPVGGAQNDSVRDIFASLVAADVIAGVKMYGERIPISSGSDLKSNRGSSKWKSDFDPSRWAPISY